MIPKSITEEVARELVGTDITPILCNTQGEAIDLPVDRFAMDDDGYYLVKAGLRFPAEAILNKISSDSGSAKFEIEFDEYLLKRRELSDFQWA